MTEFRLQIITQQRTVFDEKVHSLVLPGEDGFLGIRAKHAPIISVLTSGPVKINRNNRITEVEISGGFIEMRDNVATMLVDSLTGLAAENPA